MHAINKPPFAEYACTQYEVSLHSFTFSLCAQRGGLGFSLRCVGHQARFPCPFVGIEEELGCAALT